MKLIRLPGPKKLIDFPDVTLDTIVTKQCIPPALVINSQKTEKNTLSSTISFLNMLTSTKT